MDRLEVLLRGGDEHLVGQVREALDDAGDHRPHAVVDRAWPPVRALDHRGLVAALQELEDLARHRALDDGEQRRDVELQRAVRGAAEVQRADADLAVGGDGDALQHAGDLRLGEAVGGEPLARPRDEHGLRVRRRRHALRGDAQHPPRAAPGGDRPAVERGDLLRRDAGHGRRPPLGEAGGDRHLRPTRVQALADPLRDLLGEPFGAHARRADDDLAHDVDDDVLEARRVRGRPCGSGSTRHSIRAENGCAERDRRRGGPSSRRP